MLDQLLSMSAEFVAAAWLLVNFILLIVAGAGVMTAYYQYVKHEVKVK